MNPWASCRIEYPMACRRQSFHDLIKKGIESKLSCLSLITSWASCRIRTNDPEITNHVLWPTELKRRVGKLLISRRYNLIPLLRSRPGGFKGSWPYETCPFAGANVILFSRTAIFLTMFFPFLTLFSVWLIYIIMWWKADAREFYEAFPPFSLDRIVCFSCFLRVERKIILVFFVGWNKSITFAPAKRENIAEWSSW